MNSVVFFSPCEHSGNIVIEHKPQIIFSLCLKVVQNRESQEVLAAIGHAIQNSIRKIRFRVYILKMIFIF